MNLTDLHSFVQVAEQGSLTSAAARLGVPTSTISRRLTRLEEALGVALLHRSSRAVRLTEEGHQLHRRCAPALREIDEAKRAIQACDDQPMGELRITAPADLGTTQVMTDLFATFRTRHPTVSLDLVLTNRLVDVVNDGFDVAIRAASPNFTWSGEGLKSRSLRTMKAGLYAAPAYLEQRGRPTAPEQLAAHDLLAHASFSAKRSMVLTHHHTGAQAELSSMSILTTNHIEQLIRFVLAGMGIGPIPDLLAEPWVESGALELLLEDWEIPGSKLLAVWPSTRHLAPRVRRFLDHLYDHPGFATSR